MSELYTTACDKYYNEGIQLMTDEEFNELQTQEFPDDGDAPIGCPARTGAGGRQVVALPYPVASLNALKTDADIKKFCGVVPEIVVFEKLDGVSALYYNNGERDILTLRGDGKDGTDISFMIPILGLLPISDHGLMFRGELIIMKDYKLDGFATVFNAVGSVVNSIDYNVDIANMINFIVYEVRRKNVKLSMLVAEQVHLFTSLHTDKVRFAMYDVISNVGFNVEKMVELLLNFRERSRFIIDGLVIMANKQYDLTKMYSNGNPYFKAKFKYKVDADKAETIVTKIEGTVKTTKKVTPVVWFEPIVLAGKMYKKVSAYNIEWVNERKIGIGSRIIIGVNITPQIIEVLSEGVPVDLSREITDKELLPAKYERFFKLVGAKGFGPALCAKLIVAGYDNIGKVLHMTMSDAISIGGVTGVKIVTEVQRIMSTLTLNQLVGGMSMLGDGIGYGILSKLPADFVMNPNFDHKYTGIGADRMEIIKMNYDTTVTQLMSMFTHDEIHTMIK